MRSISSCPGLPTSATSRTVLLFPHDPRTSPARPQTAGPQIDPETAPTWQTRNAGFRQLRPPESSFWRNLAPQLARRAANFLKLRCDVLEPTPRKQKPHSAKGRLLRWRSQADVGRGLGLWKRRRVGRPTRRWEDSWVHLARETWSDAAETWPRRMAAELLVRSEFRRGLG